MNLFKSLRAAAGVGVALLLTTPAFAITGDWVDDNVHTYVGLIAFYYENGDFLWRCSGSLIGPKKFLTAGHCTDVAEGARSARVWFQQDAGAHYDPVTQHDPVTGYPDTCAAGTLGKLCATASNVSQIHNYGFDNFAGYPNTHDVGVVILDQKITRLGYGVLPTAGELDRLDTARGTKDTVFTSSGYGLSLKTQD